MAPPPDLLINTEPAPPAPPTGMCVPVDEIRPGLVEMLESIENAVRADRSRVSTIQLVRVRLQLQGMIAELGIHAIGGN